MIRPGFSYERKRRLQPKLTAAFVALAVVAAGCGGGLSLTEYAETIEVAVGVMNREVDAAQIELTATAQTPAWVQRFMERRAAARTGFLAELSGLDAPAEAEELHETAVAVVTNLRDAELALARRAAITPADNVDSVWVSQEAAALEAIDLQAIAVCDVAQASFDSTAEREAFSESSWMPPQLKEVVDVAFKCTYEERSGTGG